MKACNCNGKVVYAKRDRHVFVVCGGQQCRDAGAAELIEMLEQQRSNSEVELRIGASKDCIGHCAAAPAMVEDGEILRWVSPRRLKVEFARLGIT